MQYPNTTLFDCPGYSDSYGCARVISNGYFHYRVFSKVQNIKFILTFSYHDMIDQAKNLMKTFTEFISGFSESGFDGISKDIFAATSVMITKVPRNFDRDSIERAFSMINITRGSRRIRGYFEALKTEVTNKKRIFFMHMAEVGKLCNYNNKDIVDIDRRSKYWRRDVNADKEPDMTMVKTNIQKVLTKRYDTEDDDDFKEDFMGFGNYYKKVFTTKLTLLTKAFQLFIKDSFEIDLGRNYLEEIKKGVEGQ